MERAQQREFQAPPANAGVTQTGAPPLKQTCCAMLHNFYDNSKDTYNPFTEDGMGAMRSGEVLFCPNPSNGDHYDWFFIGDKAGEDFYTSVPRERRILFIQEPPDIRKYEKKYVDQFGIAVSPYELSGYTGRTIINNPCLGWFAGLGVGGDDKKSQLFRRLSDVRNYGPIAKTRDISIVSSLKKMCKGHMQRITFMDALKSRLGDAIDYYGRDFSPIGDKLNAIAPYKYHIAIENSSVENYWTEKLTDAWIGWSLPIYFGDPAILDQIPDPAGIVIIDINDISSAIEQIEKVLREDPYNSRLDAIKKCRGWAINEGNPYERVCRIIESADTNTLTAKKLTRKEYIKRPKDYLKSRIYSNIASIFGEAPTEKLYHFYKNTKRRFID
jgi:hypothetical protein